jgi:rSAM/selenodomain-associated transferase 1
MATRPSNSVAIAILAKAPVPGFAKTRLIPALGPDGAAMLQRRLTAQTVASACAVQYGAAKLGPVTLWAAPDESHASFRALATTHRIVLKRQPDGDLGVRMLAAMQEGPTLVIGTDCPALTPFHLRSAAATLQNGIDAVIIPTADGGYALIGTRRPTPALFQDMTWSTATVMAETRRRLAQLGLSWREPLRLWDIDVPEDLARLRADGFEDLLSRP